MGAARQRRPRKRRPRTRRRSPSTSSSSENAGESPPFPCCCFSFSFRFATRPNRQPSYRHTVICPADLKKQHHTLHVDRSTREDSICGGYKITSSRINSKHETKKSDVRCVASKCLRLPPLPAIAGLWSEIWSTHLVTRRHLSAFCVANLITPSEEVCMMPPFWARFCIPSTKRHRDPSLIGALAGRAARGLAPRLRSPVPLALPL